MGGDVRSEAIWEGAFCEEAFGALPGLMARAGRARSGLMNWRHADSDYQILAYSYFSRDLVEHFPEYLPVDPWTIHGAKLRNRVVRLDTHVPPDVFAASAAYRDLIVAHGDDTFHCMGLVFETAFGTGILSVHRGRRGGAFEIEDEGSLADVICHFTKVVQVRGELEAARREAELAHGAADRLGVAIIAVRRDRRLMFANAAAQAVLERGDGLTVRGGIVSARSAACAVKLATAVERAAAPRDPAASSALVHRGADRSPLLITAAPLPMGSGRTAALLVFRDPDAANPGLVDRLRSLFNLTAAEAAVAADLGGGREVAAIAALRGVSVHTVRVQVKALAAKMGVARQSEVAAIVAALPTLRGASLGDLELQASSRLSAKPLGALEESRRGRGS